MSTTSTPQAQGSVSTKVSTNRRHDGVSIYYHPDGFDTGRKALMGRHAAGEEFLKALTRYGSSETLYAYAQKQEHFKDFLERISKSAKHNQRCQHQHYKWIPWEKVSALGQSGCLFYPGPVLGELAWQRRTVDSRLFSLCGLTHTTATHAVMDGLADLLVAPLQPWDAVICTSQSVKSMVVRVLDEQCNYLKDRFRLPSKPQIPVQLPVIPLGVDCSKFAKSADFVGTARKKWRQLLNINEEDIVVLFVGRLSFHAKAHPMPLFRSLEECAATSAKPIHLIMAGWFANDAIKDTFMKAAQMYCPSVKVIFMDGRKTEVRDTIWYAADIFSSLSDNVQETFGLTPLEAMAAGLPVVISDWDGYRETAVHEESGFLIPTWMPPAGSAEDIALGHANGSINYDNYIGYQSQFCNVDIKSCIQAFNTLIANPGLRKQMGIAGQKRAQSVFDWRVIIGQYESLWRSLSEIRHSAAPYSDYDSAGAMPARQDPTVLFQDYPTHVIGDTTQVYATKWSNQEQFEFVCKLGMNTFAATADLQKAKEILKVVAEAGKVTVGELTKLSKPRDREAINFALLWLGKMGLICLES